ncbi:phospholipase A and acyltransferase 2-like [Glandiceps talaboti]
MGSSPPIEYNDHNLTVLDRCVTGDLLEFTRGLYSHWGVYIGDGKVIHLTGENDGIGDDLGNPKLVFSVWGKQFNKAVVKCDDFFDIVYDCKAKINNSKDKKTPPARKRDIAERAVSKLGKVGYNVLWNNCEHFASWCRYGVAESDQVNGVLTYMTIGIGAAVACMMVAKSALSATQKTKK